MIHTVETTSRRAGLEGRVPPHDLVAEQAVLGSVLVDPESLGNVIEWLMPEHFYRENHGAVYAAYRALFSAGEPIDQITVSDALDRAGALQRCGGRAQIATLAEQTPTSANIVHYGRIVQQKWRRRRAITIGGEITASAWDEDLDELEIATRAQTLAFGLSDAANRFEPEPLNGMLDSYLEGLADAMQNGPPGLKTGFSDFDSKARILRPGALVILCGATGMGKTSWALNLVLNLLKAGDPVAFFSLEMSKTELVTRLLAMEAGVSAERIDNGNIGDHEHERVVRAAQRLRGYAQLLIDEQGALSEEQLAAKARLVVPKGVKALVVDYLQLMKASKDFRGNRTQEVTFISHQVKALAKELQIPIVALAQLSRAPAARSEKRPQLSDLRDSGDLENDSDAVIGLYRPDYYDPDERQKTRVEAEVIVMKNRHGSTPIVPMVFDKTQTKFIQVDTHHEQPRPRLPHHPIPEEDD